MFHFLGTTISRTWPLWLVGWIVLFVALKQTAPAWHEVAQDREFGFLPETEPSQKGETLYKRAFPNDYYPSAVVLVFSRADSELQSLDRTFIRDVVRADVAKLAQEEQIIAATKTMFDKGSGILLISADSKATMVLIELTTEMFENRNWPLLDKIEGLINHWQQDGKAPSGLQIHLTGSATVGRDVTRGSRDSAQATEFWTILFVVLLLAAIYRAPLLAAIPLISVYLATQVALWTLSHLAAANVITLFEGIEIFITIILYGAGVDYCLFLIARYQEERERGAEWHDALILAVSSVGPALTASAGTVMLGIGMMAFADFGKFHHAGIAVSLSVLIGLVVVLTFTTALLRMAGDWAFWPRKVAQRDEAAPSEHAGGIKRIASWFSWETLGQGLMRWPATIWCLTVLAMTPLVFIAIRDNDRIDYDLLRRLPPNAPSVIGTKALQEHFPAGATGTVTVLLYHPDADFLTEDSKDQLHLEVLADRLKEQRDRLQLADIRSLPQPLGITAAGRAALNLPPREIYQLKDKALQYYVSETGDLKGRVTRMELTMQLNPLSRAGIAWLNNFEETLRTELPAEWKQAEVYFTGSTASMRDLRAVVGHDQTRIEVLVTIAVLAILMILLRRVIVSLYLIASVLFSYFATLGAAMLFFGWLDPDNFAGLDWKVPIFLFTILVAIGEDYNIFLITRVDEEQKKHGPIEGIHVALVKTGRIITSCGLIMAGTFASLLAGTMQDLRHLGFALAFGVMVDTFIVRPILAPAFFIMLERGRIAWAKMAAVAEKETVAGPRA